jgi:hypothetical protein
VVPVVFTLIDDMQNKFNTFFRRNLEDVEAVPSQQQE